MRLGREAECARIDRFLGEARAGTSAALVVSGEAGIGKTTLLAYARERSDGFIELGAVGVESEVGLPFAALSGLLRPLFGRLERIPAPQAAALAGALALGRPAPGDRFAVGAATLSLLASAAEEAPVLAVVDDAHWLDDSSAEALLFAARRLGAEGIALLFALRDGEPSRLDASGVDELRLSGLDQEASRALLGVEGRRRVAPAVASRLFEATRGNPLALVEIGALLSAAQLFGREPLVNPLPVGAGLERAFLRRVRALPGETRRALVVAAAGDTPELGPIAHALRVLGLDPEALEPAEAAGLVTIDAGRLGWRHPLLRSAIYHAASGRERRAAHRALAGALSGEGAAARRPWHLAASALAPDEEIARALEEAGIDARRRAAHAAAAEAFERAARLTPGDEARARRLLEAARELDLIGRADRAATLLDEALAGTADPLLRCDVQHLRASVRIRAKAPAEAHRLLVAEASRVEALDAGRAARLLTDAAWTAAMAGDVPTELETARRARAIAERAGPRERTLADALLGHALILNGDGRAAAPLLARCRSLFQQDDVLAAADLVQFAGQGSIWIEAYGQARLVLDSIVEGARHASALSPLPLALAIRSELGFRTGRWTSAYADASESVRLATDLQQLAHSAFCLACLARVEAGQGREEDCRAHARVALERAEAYGIGSVLTYGFSALGLLELGLGRPADAIRHLEQVVPRVQEHGLREPAVIQWAPDLVEAYALAGRSDDARDRLARFGREAERTGRTWALAAAARCRGFLAGDGEFEEPFEKALRLHRGSPTPFERARTELRYGERLRRARQLTRARDRLRSALETFERLGATPWAEQARGELAAAGAREPGRRAHKVRALTPQELQVALLVAEGATNREAAAALFLSPKTVEFHLGKVYRKLGLRSRAELARLLAGEGRARPGRPRPASPARDGSPPPANSPGTSRRSPETMTRA